MMGHPSILASALPNQPDHLERLERKCRCAGVLTLALSLFGELWVVPESGTANLRWVKSFFSLFPELSKDCINSCHLCEWGAKRSSENGSCTARLLPWPAHTAESGNMKSEGIKMPSFLSSWQTPKFPNFFFIVKQQHPKTSTSDNLHVQAI